MGNKCTYNIVKILKENENKIISIYECIKDLSKLHEEKIFLKEVDSMGLRCALFDLDNAYTKSLKKIKVIQSTKVNMIKNGSDCLGLGLRDK